MIFRIKEARENAGYSQKELAKIIGVAPNTFHGYESGKHDPKSDLLIKIAQACNVTTDFLLGHNNTTLNFKHQIDLSNLETNIIKKYRALDEHGKKMVDIVIKEETARMEQNKEEISAPLADIICLQRPWQPASAGYGQIADDNIADEVRVYLNTITAKADYIMRVSGDSMEPVFFDGQEVLVQEQQTIELGEIGIFIIGGERFIKTYRGDHLESANPNYPDVQFDEYSKCIGRVLGVLKDEWIVK